jgi:preprotein translocase subunit SecG
MLGIFIGVLTVFIVLDCLVLILLVLMQLPKKEAGAGLAFGGAATDALFGAGSGNFLTKATKYAAIVFFGLAVLLSLLESQRAHQPGSSFRRELERQQQPAAAPLAPASAPATPPADAPGSTNFQLLTPPPAPAATSAPTNAGGTAPGKP